MDPGTSSIRPELTWIKSTGSGGPFLRRDGPVAPLNPGPDPGGNDGSGVTFSLSLSEHLVKREQALLRN